MFVNLAHTLLVFLLFSFVGTDMDSTFQQEFQGKAYYFSKIKNGIGCLGRTDE